RSDLRRSGRRVKQTDMNRFASVGLLAALFLAGGCGMVAPRMNSNFQNYALDYDTPVDAALQSRLEELDATLRARYGMSADQTEVGLLDLRGLRLAMLRPDREEYAASVAKIGILLAWF